ncbi:helix-turn-helix domain-containing protein [Nocardioides speluncae]|uniref:helix-turn-helix domain-containing protein n=1 Tax=Nocardioides speluncae TaxID=2670337 RepID=UPI000D69B039|nr:AraC family transcriptional regulator [Nocardioides speluncae]
MGAWRNATTSRLSLRSLPPEARRPPTATTAGILHPDRHAEVVELARPPVSPRLHTWVENYWTVRWDLGDAPPYTSEVVTHPAVQLSVESGTTPHYGVEMPAALIHGVPTKRFRIDLSGEGRAFGVKFRPGGFGAFTGEDVGAWTDQVLPLRAAFGEESTALMGAVLAEPEDAERAAIVDEFLERRLPKPDPRYERVLAIVAGMIGDPTMISVDAVCERFEIAPRSLQRLFRRYVGVGPKWVQRRYRLHDAVTLIDAGEYDDLAELAARLGWFDQAHFTREFTEQVGQSPSAYAVSAGRPAGER